MHHGKRESGTRWALGGRQAPRVLGQLCSDHSGCTYTPHRPPRRPVKLHESNGSTQTTSVWNGTRTQRLRDLVSRALETLAAQLNRPRTRKQPKHPLRAKHSRTTHTVLVGQERPKHSKVAQETPRCSRHKGLGVGAHGKL